MNYILGRSNLLPEKKNQTIEDIELTSFEFDFVPAEDKHLKRRANNIFFIEENKIKVLKSRVLTKHGIYENL